MGLLAEGNETSFTGIHCQNTRKVNASAEFLLLEHTQQFSPNKAKIEQELFNQVFVVNQQVYMQK